MYGVGLCLGYVAVGRVSGDDGFLRVPDAASFGAIH